MEGEAGGSREKQVLVNKLMIVNLIIVFSL